MSAPNEQQNSAHYTKIPSEAFTSSSQESMGSGESSHGPSDVNDSSKTEDFGWSSPSQKQSQYYEDVPLEGQEEPMLPSQSDDDTNEQLESGNIGWQSPTHLAADQVESSYSIEVVPHTPRISSPGALDHETVGNDSPTLHVKANLGARFQSPLDSAGASHDYVALEIPQQSRQPLTLQAADQLQSPRPRTLRFSEILALPGYTAGNLPPAPPALAPPLPNPGPRNPGQLLRDLQVGNCDPASDLDAAVCLVKMGTVADPAPHYLWTESDKIIQWFISVLASKLNFLLELDASRRETKARLLKGVTPIPAEINELVLWARTGARKNIRFRYYQDWVARLQYFHQNGDLTIYDYMVLITGMHNRLAPHMGAASQAMGQGQASAMAIPLYLTARLPPQVSSQVPPQAGPFESYAQSTVMGQAYTAQPSPQQFAPRHFEVYRDEQATQSNRITPDWQPGLLHDKTNIPMQETWQGQKRKASNDTFEENRAPKTPRNQFAHSLLLDAPITNTPADTSGETDPAITTGNWRRHDEHGEVGTVPSFSQELGNWRSANEGVARGSHTSRDPEPSNGEELSGAAYYDAPHTDDEELQPAADPEIEEVQRLVTYLRINRSLPESDAAKDQIHGSNTPGSLAPSQPRPTITNAWLNAEVASLRQPPPLFFLMPHPNEEDDSLLARCIRFAQSAEQVELNWRVHGSHITEMLGRSDWYGGQVIVQDGQN
ncbi:hypothetical protein BKA63DRAFT_567933 [Paraphoma chrysanthemicola]|nr:hypothetical protein BKA63DRAFT_567933 [Paraphoma chrysanthemicola]